MRRCARWIIFVSLLFTCPLFWGQESPDEEEEQIRQYEAVAELVPDRIVRGGLARIRIRTDIPWLGIVTVDVPDIKSPLVIWESPVARTWLKSPGGGRMIEIRASIRAEKAGFYKIGAFKVRSGVGEAKTRELDLIVLNADERDLPYPLAIRWRDRPLEVWQGEVFPLVLEAQNLDGLYMPDSVSLSTSPAGILQEADNVADIMMRPYMNNSLYDVPVAVWLWVLDEPGNYSFPGGRVRMLGLERKIDSFRLKVKPLPEAVEDSFAVGNFNLDYIWSPETYAPGEIFSVRVRVQGSGNLNILNLPRPKIKGTRMISVIPDSSYSAGLEGYTGWKEERIDFEILKEGEHSLEIPGWSWLEKGQVETYSPKIFSFTASHTGNSETRTAGILLGPDMTGYGPDYFNWRYLYWSWLYLPGPIVLLLRLKFRRQKVNPVVTSGLIILFFVFSLLLTSAKSFQPDLEEMAQEVVNKAGQDDWREARDILNDMKTRMGEWPGLLHDMALVNMELGKGEEAVYNIRRADFFRPGSPRFARTLRRVEESFKLEDQVSLLLFFQPRIVFIIFLIFFNSTFILFSSMIADRSLARERTRYRKAFSLIILLIFLFLSLATMVYSHERWLTRSAVVVRGAETLKKIPDDLASDWMQLPEGTAVLVRATYRTNVLVETGYGLEGWLPESSLRFTGGRKDGF